MKNTLPDLSGKIDEKSIAALARIKQAAADLNFSFFVLGAIARDIILEHQFDIKSGRATIDIDIGVLVASWDQFENLKNKLIDTNSFSPSRETQRLVYEGTFPVDIIPFGDIANQEGAIEWPPDQGNRMSVLGFDECYRHAISVKLSSNPELVIKVTNLAGLALLKLISWDDNPERRGKDAPDIFLILRHYLDAGNLERVFDEGGEMLQEDDHDYDLISARFLGRNIGRISSSKAKAKLISILEREACSKQGHQIAMDVIQRGQYRNQPIMDRQSIRCGFAPH